MAPRFAFLLTILFFVGCAHKDAREPMALDTIKPGNGQMAKGEAAKDTSAAKPAADTSHSNLPPMAKAIEPERLAGFLPKINGWSQNGDITKEIQVRDKFNKSDVSETLTNGNKKLTIEIDDNAYVPYLYDPYTQFKGAYLDEDNTQRTEVTTVAGYHAVQTWEKQAPHGVVVIFPGSRYVVKVTEDGAQDINEVRNLAQQSDLKGLEGLQ